MFYALPNVNWEKFLYLINSLYSEPSDAKDVHPTVRKMTLRGGCREDLHALKSYGSGLPNYAMSQKSRG